MLQYDSDFARNGRRSLMEHPEPKMAAARTSAGDYQMLSLLDSENVNQSFYELQRIPERFFISI